jgi:hypothetical protein
LAAPILLGLATFSQRAARPERDDLVTHNASAMRCIVHFVPAADLACQRAAEKIPGAAIDRLTGWKFCSGAGAKIKQDFW